MTAKWNDLYHAIRAAWVWWRLQLEDLVPPAVQAWLGKERFERVDVDKDLGLGAWNNLRARATLRLFAPANCVFALEREVPFAAITSLDAILLADLDRLTPFTAGDVKFGYRIAGFDWKRQMLAVAIAVVRNADLERLRSELFRLGAGQRRAELWITDLCIAIQVTGTGSVSGSRQRRVLWAATKIAAVVLLLGLALAMPGIKLHQAADTWDKKWRSLAARAEKSAAQTDKATHDARRIETLNTQLTSELLIFDILSELAGVLPRGAWLESLGIERDEIHLIGLSPDAAQIIGRLNASKMFGEVAQKAPIERDARTGLLRFDLVTHARRQP